MKNSEHDQRILIHKQKTLMSQFISVNQNYAVSLVKNDSPNEWILWDGSFNDSFKGVANFHWFAVYFTAWAEWEFHSFCLKLKYTHTNQNRIKLEITHSTESNQDMCTDIDPPNDTHEHTTHL